VLQGSSSSSSSSGSSSGAGSPGSNSVWTQMDGMDVSGKDIPAGGKAFTEVCVAEAQGLNGARLNLPIPQPSDLYRFSSCSVHPSRAVACCLLIKQVICHPVQSNRMHRVL